MINMKKFKNNIITVLGAVQKLGNKAPNFTAIDKNLEEKSLTDYKTPYIVLNVVPSLDTGVCDAQTRRVNEELVKEMIYWLLLFLMTYHLHKQDGVVVQN